MIHGWLDNALSFARLAPLLARDRDVYAIGLAGHGQSGHRQPGQGYALTDYIADLAELVETYFRGHEDSRQPDLQARADAIAGLYIVSLPGGHHCHPDGDVGPIASAVRDFIDVC